MQKLSRATIRPITDAQYAAMVAVIIEKSDMTAQQAREFIDDSRAGECWMNDIYTVLKREYEDGVVHLSIRRNDRGPARDWRHFQQIKNQLLGEEVEAVEIYPAESRVVDAANQYHLWARPGVRVPFGFATGFRCDESMKAFGSVQRSTK